MSDDREHIRHNGMMLHIKHFKPYPEDKLLLETWHVSHAGVKVAVLYYPPNDFDLNEIVRRVRCQQLSGHHTMEN